MIIAQQKRKENIAEYLLYMWQVEDMIRKKLKEIEKKDIDDMLIHELTGRNSNNSAPNQEIEYIRNFKD